MKLLVKSFVKNGLVYETLSRSPDIGLFKLFLRDSSEHDKNLAWDYFYKFGEELRLKKAITMPNLPLYKGKTPTISEK